MERRIPPLEIPAAQNLVFRLFRLLFQFKRIKTHQVKNSAKKIHKELTILSAKVMVLVIHFLILSNLVHIGKMCIYDVKNAVIF